MYKIETHLHTKPVSSCSHIGPEEMIRLCSEAGYTTVFVSDHLSPYHFSLLGDDLSWKQRLELFYAAYLAAEKAGRELGVTVLFAPEMSLADNHYLLYNMDRLFFELPSGLFDMSLAEFRRFAVEHGVTVIQAHPLRDGVCTPQPDFVDGFEAINSNPRHENFDGQVLALAKQHGLPCSAGSDAHRLEDINGAAVLSPHPIKTADEYLALLKSGEAKLWKRGEIQ